MVKKKSLEWRNCSEEELRERIDGEILGLFGPNVIVFLEGEMGAGKSSLVRVLMRQLAPKVASQGSPTFPLVQEYRAEKGFPIYHMDLYRLKNEAELEDSGIEAQIEERGALVFIEWASLFEDYFSFYQRNPERISKKSIQIFIEPGESETRNYRMLF